MSGKFLNIIPNASLVENIGYGQDATHKILDEELNKTRLSKEDIVNIIDFEHPSNIQIDHIADKYTFTNFYKKSFLKRIKLKAREKFKSIFSY